MSTHVVPSDPEIPLLRALGGEKRAVIRPTNREMAGSWFLTNNEAPRGSGVLV